MKITIIHPSPHGVHDGQGGVHKQGDTPDLPDDVATMLIERGMAKAAEAPPKAPGKGA